MCVCVCVCVCMKWAGSVFGLAKCQIAVPLGKSCSAEFISTEDFEQVTKCFVIRYLSES